jgi:hypothetical protein
MKFTSTEARSIEHTMDKLTTVAYTMWDRQSTDGANARAISYIIGEIRACADLMKSDDRAIRLAAADRLAALITE